MLDNLDNIEKEKNEKTGQQKKKRKAWQPQWHEKEQLRIYEKKGKKVMRDNLDDIKKEHLRK